LSFPSLWFGPPFSPSLVCHSEDEESFSLLAGADFLRCKESRRNLITQAFKVSGDLRKSEAEVAGHVFEKHDCRFNFANDSTDVRPKVSRIVLSTALAGDTEWLAGVARSDAIHDVTPRSAVEGSEIRPDRCLIQDTRFHRRHQVVDGESFPLHPTDRASASQSQFESEVESGTAGAE
jgi:hypothetical protein